VVHACNVCYTSGAPMSDDALPFVDVHEALVDAGVDDAWAAVCAVADAPPSRAALLGARALGCRDAAPGGPRPLRAGSTTCGFRVAGIEAPRELALEGGHRFAEYALTFRVSEIGPGRARISAETRAAFPGVLGRLYRAAVIGSGGHVAAVRRLLRAIQRRAARAPG
jgi:Protein of unknown function (DUF2867)